MVRAWMDSMMGAAVVVMIAGCGPGVGDDDAGDSAADTTGAGDGSTGADPSATGMTSVDGGVDSSGGESGGDVCSEFDAQIGSTITMGVLNMTNNPVFLARNGCDDPIALRVAEGQPPATLSFPDCELPACHQAVEGNCGVACAGGGGACQQTVIRIDPGVTHQRVWDGSVWVDGTLPAQCLLPDCEPQCFQQTASVAGTFTIDVLYSGCPNLDAASCECENGEDTCDIVLEDGIPSPMPANLTVDFEYPAESMPTIVIQ